MTSPPAKPRFEDPLPNSRTQEMLDQLEVIFLRDGFRSVTVEQLARQPTVFPHRN